MHLPAPLKLLLAWIEDNRFCVEYEHGRAGYLFPQDRVQDAWDDLERPGGTMFHFMAQGNRHIGRWLGNDRPEIINRLCVFGYTGYDGSMAAFWLDDNGQQKIVHMGSGSGSTLVCVLADDPVDFLRLLAIGYEEICCPKILSKPLNADREDDSPIVLPNLAFQDWVKRTFSVSIPRVGIEIVRHFGDMDEDHSLDPFWRWIVQHRG